MKLPFIAKIASADDNLCIKSICQTESRADVLKSQYYYYLVYSNSSNFSCDFPLLTLIELID